MAAGPAALAAAPARSGDQELHRRRHEDRAGDRHADLDARHLRLWRGEKASGGGGVYVEVETAGGLVGHGMTTIVDSQGTAALINLIAAREMKGENAMNNEAIWEKLYWTLTPRGQTGVRRPCDGRLRHRPVGHPRQGAGRAIATLLGGARPRFRSMSPSDPPS